MLVVEKITFTHLDKIDTEIKDRGYGSPTYMIKEMAMHLKFRCKPKVALSEKLRIVIDVGSFWEFGHKFYASQGRA